MTQLISEVRAAAAEGDADTLTARMTELEDLLFYVA